MGAPNPSGFSSMVGIQSELWKSLMQVGWKDAFNYSMSWFECTWFNDNDLEFFNQLWLHFFQWNFIFGLTTTLVEFDLFYLMALSGFRVDFFLCCSIKNQFMTFFFPRKVIWSWSFEESSLCPSSSVQLLPFPRKISLVLPQAELGFLSFPAVLIPYIYIPWSQKSSFVLFSLLRCLQAIVIYII